MKPRKGLHIIVEGVASNGANDHPAIVTRVWSDVQVAIEEAPATCNATVFSDNSSPHNVTSLLVFGSRAQAAAHFQLEPDAREIPLCGYLLAR